MDPIRVVGISASPRHRNTELLVREALSAAEEAYGVRTEYVSFKGKTVKGCCDCKGCIRREMPTAAEQCVLEDDWRELITPLVNPVPRGVIIAELLTWDQKTA